MSNKAMVDLLISKGAKLKKVDNDDEIPLFIAIRASNNEVIDKLLEGFKMNTTNRKRQTALHLACISGSTEIARKLIDYGAELNARDVFGNTPLHYATMGDWGEIVNILLIHKTDATIRNAKGKSPFFYASVEVAKLFRQHFQADGALDSLSAAVHMQAASRTQTPTPRRMPKPHSPINKPRTPQKTSRQQSQYLKQDENLQQDHPQQDFQQQQSPQHQMQSPHQQTSDSSFNSPTKDYERIPEPINSVQQKKIISVVNTEDFEQFKAEMRQELDSLTQKMNQMMIELKQQVSDTQNLPKNNNQKKKK